MKGLLYKDMMNLSGQFKVYLVFILLYGGISIYGGNLGFLTGILGIMSAILPTSAYAYDERAGWDRLALTMPIRREELVACKYLLGWILILIAFLLTVTAQLLIGSDLAKSLFVGLILVATTLLYLSVLLPMLFRFGVEMSRVIYVVLLLVPAFAVSAAVLFFTVYRPFSVSKSFFIGTICAFIFLAALINYGSLRLSVKIYRKKEL